MNNTVPEAFCYFGRLTLNAELDALLKLLPEEEQTSAREFWLEIQKLPNEVVQQRLMQLRHSEIEITREYGDH